MGICHGEMSPTISLHPAPLEHLLRTPGEVMSEGSPPPPRVARVLSYCFRFQEDPASGAYVMSSTCRLLYINLCFFTLRVHTCGNNVPDHIGPVHAKAKFPEKLSFSTLFTMMSFLKSVAFGVLIATLVHRATAEEHEDSRNVAPRVDLGDIAKEILGRQGTNSQVLSLNVTNLIILLVLKGLLFGATYWGQGGYGYGGYKARSLETQEIVNENELMLITSYLMGDVDKDYSCLYRVACQDPAKSKNYLQGAKILLKGSKIFSDYIGYDEKYEALVRDFQEAIDFGSKYGTCEQKYTCNKAGNNV